MLRVRAKTLGGSGNLKQTYNLLSPNYPLFMHRPVWENTDKNLGSLRYSILTDYKHLSCCTTKPTKWLCQAKSQILPVWSEPSLCTQWVAKDPRFLHAPRGDSDLSLRWVHIPFCWFCHQVAHFKLQLLQHHTRIIIPTPHHYAYFVQFDWLETKFYTSIKSMSINLKTIFLPPAPKMYNNLKKKKKTILMTKLEL